MNNTKWDELRLGMHGLKQLSPQWRTLDVNTGYLSSWDGEWFYHFKIGGYKRIAWVEMKIESKEQEEAVFKVIEKIHLPGERIESGLRIYGYISEGQEIDYFPHSPCVED